MPNINVMKDVFKVETGSLNPFALINDSDNKVTHVIIDQNLKENEYFAFHPIQNDATIEIKQSDFDKYMQKIDKTYEFLVVDQIPVLQNQIQEKKVEKKVEKKQATEKEEDGGTKLCIEYKKDLLNFSKWYQQVILKSDMIEYYDISGCYILRPWSYSIWEFIQEFLDKLIKKDEIENCYFPIFVSEEALIKEKDHVEGFAAEVAWVTKSGKNDLHKPIAIRPTSETIMYPAFSKWIQSHRDLPLKLNQWSNVVRWEFKHPTPFLRTREFLWQEGHTAHTSDNEATEMTYNIQEHYRKVYEELLAVPVIKGIKTNVEKFAGGNFTTTIETIIPTNGRGIQAATSHHLGQNFSKMFDISYSDEKHQQQLAWQTSWGLTTRTIGVMTMVHGDDKGLILPPKVAKYQIIIIPITTKENENQILEKCKEIKKQLQQDDLRVHVDDRNNYRPGWKYNHWELKGVPLRIEFGQKDLQKNEVKVVKRLDNTKEQLKLENLGNQLKNILNKIQQDMFIKARNNLNNSIKEAFNWKDFMIFLNQKNGVLTPWCEIQECEEKVQVKSANESKQQLDTEDAQNYTSAAKTLCKPLEQQKLKEGEMCFHCKKEAKVWVLWGRSY